jgi:hypothetical protein
MKIRKTRIAIAGVASASAAALLLPTAAMADSTLVTGAGTIAFENPFGTAVGTDWMSDDFSPSPVILGAASSVAATARVHPWAISDAQGAGAASWTFNTNLTGIPLTEADVFLPVPRVTTAPGSTGVVVVPAAFNVPTQINNGNVLIATTGAPGTAGQGYFTISFASPMRARVLPTGTPGTYPGVWNNTLA